MIPSSGTDGAIDRETVGKPTLGAWATLAALTSFYVLSFVDRQILTVMIEPIKRDLRVDDVQMSLLFGLAFSAFYTVCGLVMGGLVDRYPRRMVVYAGVTIWSLATAACGLAADYSQLFAGRMAVGIGEATLTPAAFSILADIFPARRLSLAVAVFITGSAIGTALSLTGGGAIIAMLSQNQETAVPLLGMIRSWQVVFLGLGVVGTILATTIFLVPEPGRRTAFAAGGDDTPTWRHTLSWIGHRPMLWCAVFLAYMPVALATTVTAVWTPSYFSRNFGWNPAEVGLAVTLAYALPLALGAAFSGFMVDRLYARGVIDAHYRYLLVTGSLSLAIAVAAFVVSDPILCLALIAVASFLFMGSGGFAAAGVQMVTPNRLRGRIAAFYMALITLPAFLIGPSLVALLSRDVFQSEKALGKAMAATMAGLMPILIVGCLIGMAAMRRLLKAAPK